MKHIKTYESLNRPMKNGDYAIVFWNIYVKEIGKHEEQKFIVKIQEIKTSGRDKGEILVRRLNEGINYLINPAQVLYWSENKEELETLLAAEKYNL